MIIDVETNIPKFDPEAAGTIRIVRSSWYRMLNFAVETMRALEIRPRGVINDCIFNRLTK
jgi:hypothetical protein